MDDNIEIVIKISEKEYNGIKEDNSGMFGGHIYQAIKDGRKLSDYPPNYQRIAIGLPPVIHHEKPITKENIDKSVWIPVSERLPEEECDCLVTTRRRYNISNNLEVVSCSYYPDMRSKWFLDGGGDAENVIAWMPLPEPYKESEE